jgi:hypothetical protein
MCEAHRRRFLAHGLGLGAIGLAVAAGPGFAQQDGVPAQPGQKWICPPCGCPSDGKDFDQEGVCPSCSMPLIPKPAAKGAAWNSGPPTGRP